ncbi:MAG TPA: Mur ligase family protein [Longimicrobiales bacterium]|nr:Mur ligase family protein [Longimicrobiales bacterium]
MSSAARTAAALLDAVTGSVRRPAHLPDRPITRVVSRASDVTPGSLFVAIPGTSADGHTFLADAARRGAVLAVVERDVGGTLDVPLVRVENARRALAEMAAAWHGHPHRELTMVGITGTAGKTSVLSLLEAILLAADQRVGSIGSLGLHLDGRTLDETVYTTPDPVLLHRDLARILDEGGEITVMEVTSHALAQDRVHGLQYRIGIFTNLLPLEHQDYHDGFDGYVKAKSRFLDMLLPDAPLVYNADDPVVSRLVRDRALDGVPCGHGPDAAVRVETPEVGATGTRLRLQVVRPFRRLGGDSVEPLTLEARLRLLGRGNIANATVAATAALILGVAPPVIASALAEFPPPPRRMEVVYRGRFTILDDTVGHPESVSAVFELAEQLSPRRLHVVWGVRGQRGEQINRENAETLAIWAAREAPETLIITRSTDTADELNRVQDDEYAAFLDVLREHHIAFQEDQRMGSAVHGALERAGEGDLVLLLGAQGMNEAGVVARRWLGERGLTADAPEASRKVDQRP